MRAAERHPQQALRRRGGAGAVDEHRHGAVGVLGGVHDGDVVARHDDQRVGGMHPSSQRGEGLPYRGHGGRHLGFTGFGVAGVCGVVQPVRAHHEEDGRPRLRRAQPCEGLLCHVCQRGRGAGCGTGEGERQTLCRQRGACVTEGAH